MGESCAKCSAERSAPNPARAGAPTRVRSSAVSLRAAAEHDPTATRASATRPLLSFLERSGNKDVGQNLIGATNGLPITNNEVSQEDTARSRSGDEFYFCIEHQQRRNAVGGRRGVTEIAGYRATILYLYPSDFAGCAFKAVVASG